VTNLEEKLRLIRDIIQLFPGENPHLVVKTSAAGNDVDEEAPPAYVG
jgi:hypothetical protein